jgi:predicted nucleic acid-binding protein
LKLAIVVSDTSPIRALAHLNLLGVLDSLFGQVIVPPSVDAELRNPPVRLTPVDVRTLGFVLIQAPQDVRRVEQLRETLDPGESEAIVLALELGAMAILMDERAGRAMAKQLGLMPIGVLGTLVRAKQRGLIGPIAPITDRLEQELGFFISASLRAEILKSAGER